jgi:hypothetical protein
MFCEDVRLCRCMAVRFLLTHARKDCVSLKYYVSL